MNGKEYQGLCLRTASAREEDTEVSRLVNYAVGLAGELGEIAQLTLLGPRQDIAHAFKAELGDMWWYTAMAQHALGYCDLDAFIEDSAAEDARMNPKHTLHLVAAVGEFVDLVKKVAFQGHPLEEHEEQLRSHLKNIVYYLSIMANPAVVRDANIEKLKLRYPDGFSAERSMNRDE